VHFHLENKAYGTRTIHSEKPVLVYLIAVHVTTIHRTFSHKRDVFNLGTFNHSSGEDTHFPCAQEIRRIVDEAESRVPPP
jgi:hypothetical protein